jgi:hypothetical protein
MNQERAGSWLLRVAIAIAIAVLTNEVGFGQDLSGVWRGNWNSQSTGHRGRLSATFRQDCPGYVNARFRGTFAKVIPFVYRARLQVVHQQPGYMVLAGSKKLGPIMGQFEYYAEVQDGCFSASYSSKRDRGTWIMSKPR